MSVISPEIRTPAQPPPQVSNCTTPPQQLEITSVVSMDTTQTTPTTSTAPRCISRSSSHQNLDTDSGKSSCSPALLDCSFDSGIGGVIDGSAIQLQKRIQHCKRILMALKRDRDSYSLLRERLSKIVVKKTPKDSEDDKFCNVCCAEIDTQNVHSIVVCCICKKHICRGANCADWNPKTAEWECQLCHSSKESLAQTSSWVAEQMSFNQQKLVYPMRARSEIYIPISDCNESSMQFESVSQIGLLDAATITAEQKVKIREYVEELVAKMLGGSLNNVSVANISKSETYLPAIASVDRTALANDAASTNSSADQYSIADMSHARLKQLIESIIAETLNLPAVTRMCVSSEVALDTRTQNGGVPPLTNGSVRRHRTEYYFEPNTYQDLLATAVLNKIVDKQKNGAARRFSESSPNLSANIIDTNYNVENQSTTSGSSIEPRSDCSYTDTEQLLNQLDNDKDNSPYGSDLNIRGTKASKILSAGRESALSDYIASHMVPLPDFSAPVTESEEDDFVSETCSTIGDGNWDDNWLFKKKRPSASAASSSVGMLVPAPKEDIRAQIGDKTTDEVSDLSELGSDSDELSLDLIRGNVDPINDRLLNKHLIGGQNTKIVLDEMFDRSSLISATSIPENEPKITETKNDHVIESGTATEAFNPIEMSEQPQNKTNTPVPPEAYKNTTANNEPKNNPLSGSIAEREYNKWNNAVEMPNNPYAPEALKRRISGSQERFMDLPNISPTTEQNPIALMKAANAGVDETGSILENDYKRYSRDYYINSARQTAPNGRRQLAIEQIANISDDPTTDHITINEEALQRTQRTATSTATEPPLASKEIEHTTYQALPATVVEDGASIETLSNQSIQSANTTTSDDSDTVRIYDFNKQETTVLLREATRVVPFQAAATLSTSVDSVESLPSDTTRNKSARERPNQLNLHASPVDGGVVIGAATSTTSTGSPFTPARGSTPTAFKFLQPKRKLIEPSQVLSMDDDEPAVPAPASVEKVVIEEDVVHILPSVKALAHAFLMTSNKCPQTENRWKAKIHKTKIGKAPMSPVSPVPERKLEAHVSLAEIAEDATIASDLSSLEMDPPPYHENKNSNAPIGLQNPPGNDNNDNGDTGPAPVRSGFLRSNIAFFENLKFK